MSFSSVEKSLQIHGRRSFQFFYSPLSILYSLGSRDAPLYIEIFDPMIAPILPHEPANIGRIGFIVAVIATYKRAQHDANHPQIKNLSHNLNSG